MKKTNKKKIGNALIMLGCACILIALGFLSYNVYRGFIAEKSVDEILPKLKAAIVEEQNEEMPVVEIDGYYYIGYLTIPRFNQELPCMADWSYSQLNLAPCRHFGSTKTDDLVIAGHNFANHFGNIPYLNYDDVLIFEDMGAETRYYKVVNNSIVYPNQTEQIKKSPWDLVLYTCNWSGLQRHVIGANKISKAEYDKLLYR